MLNPTAGPSLGEIIARHRSLTADDARKGFCAAWPETKKALDLLRSILTQIPTTAPIAGPAITLVESLGDHAAEALCSQALSRPARLPAGSD